MDFQLVWWTNRPFSKVEPYRWVIKATVGGGGAADILQRLCCCTLWLCVWASVQIHMCWTLAPGCERGYDFMLRTHRRLVVCRLWSSVKSSVRGEMCEFGFNDGALTRIFMNYLHKFNYTFWSKQCCKRRSLKVEGRLNISCVNFQEFWTEKWLQSSLAVRFTKFHLLATRCRWSLMSILHASFVRKSWFIYWPLDVPEVD